jgi:hypothetical protein
VWMASLTPKDWLTYFSKGSDQPQPFALGSFFTLLLIIGVRRAPYMGLIGLSADIACT